MCNDQNSNLFLSWYLSVFCIIIKINLNNDNMHANILIGILINAKLNYEGQSAINLGCVFIIYSLFKL